MTDQGKEKERDRMREREREKGVRERMRGKVRAGKRCDPGVVHGQRGEGGGWLGRCQWRDQKRRWEGWLVVVAGGERGKRSCAGAGGGQGRPKEEGTQAA